MKQAILTIRQHPVSAGLLPALLACFLFLFFRNSGIYPVVFIDEWIYASATRMLPLAQAEVPSYLYFKLYGITSYCGDGYLECNRVLNELFYVGAGPLIYLLARRVAGPLAAGVVAVAAVLAPANALTPYFMPEAPYFFAFWLICWTCMWVYDAPRWTRAAVLGALLGLTAMVKLHAIFLLPGALLFVAALAWAGHAPQPGLRQPLVLCAALLLAFAVTRFGIGIALAGKDGLYLLGKLYADQAKYVGRAHLPFAQLLQLAANNLRGQSMMLALLFGVPMAALGSQLFAIRRANLQREPALALALLCFLMLGSALAVTVAFTASITGLGEMETAARIHTRYYHFALPLLLICGAAAMREGVPAPRVALRAVIGLMLVLLVVHAWKDLLRLFTPNITDSPELRAASLNPAAFAMLCLLGAGAVLAWVIRPASGAKAFTWIFLPVSTLVLAAITAQQVRLSIWPDDYSKAGQFVRHYLHTGQTNNLTIVADDMGGMHRARFFIENPNTGFLQVPQNAPVDWDKLPPGKTWVLAIGNYALPADARIVAQKDNFALLQAGIKPVAGHTLSFNVPLPSEFVQRVDGLAGAESWGAWSDGPSARLQFTRPLPRRLQVHLTGRAFGPNAGKDFILRIGGQERPFRLLENSTTAELEFTLDAGVDTLELLVPAPTSPQSLGMNDDRRQLGAGIESMKFVALP